MRLLDKYNRLGILAAICVLLVGGAVYYVSIRAVLTRQLDQSLVVEEQEIRDEVTEHGQLPEASYSDEEQEEYYPGSATTPRRFSSVYVGHVHSRHAYFRQLEFPVNVAGAWYRAVVRKSEEKTEDLIELTLKITLLIIALLLVALFAINRLVLNRLWRPFYSTLRKLQQFNLAGGQAMQLEPTSINEFRQLNEAVSQMATQAVDEYNEVKHFTENASHEMQTPLAILSSKLELLHQTELDEAQAQHVAALAGTVNRLSKLNQSLILLTRIDNRQFAGKRSISLAGVVRAQAAHFEELLLARDIRLSLELSDSGVVDMNETLADVLVLNLLTNAIKHNFDGGSIRIIVASHQLVMSNTGAPPTEDPQVYFERFRKGSARPDSLGLGLSIVKKICHAYGFFIRYDFTEGEHRVTVEFPRPS